MLALRDGLAEADLTGAMGAGLLLVEAAGAEVSAAGVASGAGCAAGAGGTTGAGIALAVTIGLLDDEPE